MRLQRLEWLHTDCPVYFLTACTRGRRRTLANGAIHRAFVEFAGRSADRHVYVGRYVIMPDHLHLFAAFALVAPSLSEWLKGLKRVLSEELKRRGTLAPYWQKGFFDHVLRSEESYSQKWRYVWQNPVRAGLVPRAEDWPYQGEIHPLVMPQL
ncbi:MAG TPA: transposase [Terriglobia bacterium]|nr:transposase [Terriglobia bacterium]